MGEEAERIVLTATEMAGFIGVGLAGAAYLPQIWHLVREHCSGGISRFAFGAWLVASVLVTMHAIAIRAGVFVFLGAVQIVATTVILWCAARYAGSYCASHDRPLAQTPGNGIADSLERLSLPVRGRR